MRVAADTYQVQDRPDLARLLVSGSAQGTAEHSRPRLVAVATRFLAETGRGGCQVADGAPAAYPFFEATYRCDKPHARAAEAVRRDAPRASPPAGASVPLRMNRL